MADNKLENPLTALIERIDALEARNVFQDDVIEQLSQELAVHQAQIADLKYQLQVLASRIKDSTAAQGMKNEVEPPPPHY
ncbi:MULTISPECIES: SlyX family protein [Thalassomonas]|uniref:SlyX family protein n=1 Tax=Thalassomonas actiniarum TaxID=485447 RepID=A0AAE9YPH7_9GAMM|nr:MULTISPECIES: SlyX family protein [Thalassomonas]WDD98869.1 SlyX family protein [Thalassomonas actiniarum]